MLDERAREMGFENIPVKFTVFISPPELVLGPQMDITGWMRLCCANAGAIIPGAAACFFS